MRNVASLLEPILLHLASDKAKERHDAVTRLKAILDGDPNTFKIETGQAVKLVQSFVKLLRLELKTHLIPRSEASYEEIEAAKNMTSIQSNKVNQLMKDLKWLLGLMDAWFPSTLLLLALPDLYNFFLDVLESCLTSIHGDILSIMRSLVFCRKAYLFEMRPDQMARLMNIISEFVFPGDGTWLSVSLESDVIGCLFFAILAIPNDVCTWSENAYECSELLIGLLDLTRQRNHESMAICMLFRSVNYLMNQLKARDPVSYNTCIDQITPLMLSYSTFKTVSVLEEYYIFFLSNSTPEAKSSPVLESIANAEIAKSRMKPADLDFIKLEECIWAYKRHDQSFPFPKGYFSFIIALDFARKFRSSSNLSFETALKMGPGSAETLSLALFTTSYELASILKLFERSNGPSQNFLAAMILAKLRVSASEKDSVYLKDSCSLIFGICVALILKHCAVQNACRILYVVIGLRPDLVPSGPKFEKLVECLHSCVLSEPCLNFLFAYYGVYFRGLWWSSNALDGYRLICNVLMQAMESSNDPRSLLDVLISHSHLLAKLLMIPFSKNSRTALFFSSSWKYPENECLQFFPMHSEKEELSVLLDFEIQLEPSQIDVFADCFCSFKTFLNEFVQTIGFQSIKILIQNHFQTHVKEDNFWSGLTQLFSLYCHIYSSGSIGPLGPSIPAVIPIKDVSRIAEAVGIVDDVVLVGILKLLIQSFEFFKFRNASNQDLSSFTGNKLGNNRAHSYLDHFDDKSHNYSYQYMEVLFFIKNKLEKCDKATLDQDSVLFLEDFALYSVDQYSKLLSEASVFLNLIHCLAFASFNESFVGLIKSPLYRSDEVAITSLAQFLTKSLSEGSNLLLIKPFAESLLKKYLKWSLSLDSKLAILELVLKMCQYEMLNSDTIWKILLDPDVTFVKSNRELFHKLRLCLPTGEYVKAFGNEGIIWQNSTCAGEVLTKIELLESLILHGMVDIRSGLGGLCFGMPREKLDEFSIAMKEGIHRLIYEYYRPSFGVDILWEWVHRGLSYLSFPAHLFLSPDKIMEMFIDKPALKCPPEFEFYLAKNHSNFFLSDPKIFTQIVVTRGVTESIEILKPPPEFLKKCFPHLVGVALVLYFSGQHECTDQILSQLLKSNLPNGEFEACFRDNVMEIIFAVIEYALRCGKPEIIDQSVSHIATMFKYDSCVELYVPAYASQLLSMALEMFQHFTKRSLEIIEFLASRCNGLLSEPVVVDLIMKFMLNTIHNFRSYPESLPSIDQIFKLTELIAKEGDPSLFIASILGQLRFSPDLFDLLKFQLKPLITGDLKCLIEIIERITISGVLFGEQMDRLVFAFLDQTYLETGLIKRMLHSNCLGPKSASLITRLMDYYDLGPEIVTFLSAKKVESVKPIQKQHSDLLYEVLHILHDSIPANIRHGGREILAAITQLLSSESICSAGAWNSLDAKLKSRIAFLKLSTEKRRLLLPKFKPKPYTEGIESTLASTFLYNEESSSLVQYLAQEYGKNPIWLKIGFVLSNSVVSRNFLPAVFEDCYFSNPSQQAELIKLVGRLAPIETIICVMERLVCRLKPGMRIEYDFKNVGQKLASQDFSHCREKNLRALFFFEYGLSSFESVSPEDADTLEMMYEAIGAKDYAGSFSDSTRLARINTELDQLLNGASGFNAETAQSQAPLWQLQQWDIETIPETFSINQPLVDEFNIMKCIAKNKPECLRVLLDQIMSRSSKLEGSTLKIVNAGMKFVNTHQLEIDQQNPDAIDLCLLSMRANCQSKLAETAAQVLSRYRSENDLLNIKSTLSLLENSADSMGLRFVLTSEKSRMLWEKGSKEQAIHLIKMTLRTAPSGPIDDVFLREYVASTYCLVADWLLQSRSEKPSSIKENYLDTALGIIGKAPSNSDTLAYVYSTYAKFVDHLFDQMNRAENLEFREQLLKQSKHDLDALTKLAQNGKDDAVLRSLKESEKQYNADMADFEEIEKSRTSFLLLAVENYLRCLQLVDKHDYSVFRVCSLWLQHYLKVPQLSQLIASSLGRVPCHKFLPLIYQLAARAELSEIRSSENGDFQDTLERLLYRMAVKHPYHCVYQVLALKSGAQPAKQSKRKLVYSTETLEVRRAAAAAALIAKLKAGDARVAKIVESIEVLCNAYTELADVELPPDTKTNVNIAFDSRWSLGKISRGASSTSASTLQTLAIPTKAIPVDPSGQYLSLTTISGFGDGFRVVGGINLPKIIDCVGSDGQVYRQLVKGKDDVRQDAVMEQVFCLVDQMLKSNEATRKKGLGIRTYRIIPLHALAGLLEWVSDTVPLGEYVLPAHEKYHPDDLGVKAARNHMKVVWEDASSSISRKLKTYLGICSRFRPVLRHFFWETSKSPSDWWDRRVRYVTSCAATSMLGHVVGLGDRHCQNILLDKKTGELIQIDLNMIFELGKTLRVPERVPFRLTRDIVDGMGPAGTEGGFTKASEETMRLLRKEAETILMILEVFKYDPLYRWNLNPIKQARNQFEKEGSAKFKFSLADQEASAREKEATSTIPPEADRALLRVREKLLGFEEGGGVQLSESGQIKFLIQAASSPEALSQMYIGWQPWV